MDPKTSNIIGTKVWVCDMQDSNIEKPFTTLNQYAQCTLNILLVKC